MERRNMIEWLKMNKSQWIIKRKDKTYPIKNLESLIAYSVVFNIRLDEIENAIVKMELDDLNYAVFENRRLKNMEKRTI